MRKCIPLAILLMVAACQPEQVDTGAEIAKAETGAAKAQKQSEASWDGKNAGQLQFSSAACMIMNGEIINFYAPAAAKDNIGDEDQLLPQINGTKAGAGWVANIMVANGITHSGTGQAEQATGERLELTAKMMDGASLAQGEIEQIEGRLILQCTDIDDLGTFR